MGIFGNGPDLQMEHERMKAQAPIRVPKKQFRKAGSDKTGPAWLDKYPETELGEARGRYKRENPSRLRWLFKIGEWIGRRF